MDTRTNTQLTKTTNQFSVKCLYTKVKAFSSSWTLRWFYMGLIARWRNCCGVQLELEAT
jgi:hypothetical protein